MATEQQYQQVVFNTAKNCGLSDSNAKIITAQATLESGHFKSAVFLSDNNPFGMKVPSRRPKTYIDGSSSHVMRSEGATPYAHYDSLGRAVQDLILGYHVNFKTDWNRIESAADYAAKMKKNGYYGGEQSTYESNLTFFTDGFNWLKKTGALPIGLILLAGILFFMYKN